MEDSSYFIYISAVQDSAHLMYNLLQRIDQNFGLRIDWNFGMRIDEN